MCSLRFFEPHRNIGHIEILILIKPILSSDKILKNYVSYVPVWFKKLTRIAEKNLHTIDDYSRANLL